ncbi:flagellar filament capping protein FliD [Simplicispira psychrophila]|uniref:flagellar filament capping protein FliD n=1 Tax=Simplicispira psychrophila TaxID=80882 RepID=UPI00047F20C1|nr:flagellar filament capping protein FliD [Simplicispira psychrophila]
MATLSSPGIGTGGLDVKSIISQLVALEKRPLDTLKLQAATTTTKISAFGQIKSLVSTLSDAASKLTSVTGWNNVATTSSDSAFVSATATGGTQATSFNVEVQALAKSQSTASGSITGAVGAGTLKIELGSWGATTPGATGTFVRNASTTAIDITVSASDTVADIASKINGSNAGVTATLLTDAGGQRLLLRSKETGLESGFQLTTADGALGALSRLTSAEITPAATQIAANAKATVNGIAVESATNTFAATVAGVTFKAEKLTDSGKPITISVAKDTSAIQANVEAFVKAYNEVNKTLNEGTKYDKASKTVGLFQGDSTALGLQSALRSAMQAVSPGSTVYQRLADIGIVQKTSSDPMATAALGGELTVDTAKLNKALSDNPEEVKKFFRGDSNVATNGLAVKLKTLAAGMLATGGFFSSKDTVLQASLKRNEQDQASVNIKASNFEKRITARYSALDTQMSSLNALNAYVSQQVTTWNKSNG